MKLRSGAVLALATAVVGILLPGAAFAAGPSVPSPPEGGGGRGGAGVVTDQASVVQVPDGPDLDTGRHGELSAANMAGLKQAVERRQSPSPGGIHFNIPAGDNPDDANGSPAAAPIAAAPTVSRAWDAVAATQWIPPDSHVAAGPDHLVAGVNSSWAVYDKTGAQLYTTTLLSWFANVLPSNGSGYSVFDPWVLYDQFTGRFAIVADAKNATTQKSYWVIATSSTSSATGSWCNWALDATLNGSTSTSYWMDYPRAGTTATALILSGNMFNWANPAAFQYAKVRFLPKSVLFGSGCGSLSWYDYWNLKNADKSVAFTVEPAQSYTSWNYGYLVDSQSTSGSSLSLWKADTTSPGSPTLTLQTTIGVASYSAPPNAAQKGSNTKIDSGDARLLGAVWRGNGLWTAHATSCTWSGDTATRSCIRWYQLNPSTGSVVQASTYGASGSFYLYPAISADGSGSLGNAVIAFNRVGSGEYVGIRYTGRVSSDTANMLQGSASLRTGQGCYVLLDLAGRDRWGDYNGAAWDQATGTYWLFSEYAFGTSTTCGNNTWQTTIAQVSLP